MSGIGWSGDGTRRDVGFVNRDVQGREDHGGKK